MNVFKSPLANEVMARLDALRPDHVVSLIEESFDPHHFGGSSQFLISIDEIQIECIGRGETFTVGISEARENEWHGVPFLYLFLTRANAADDMINSMRQIQWLIDDIDLVLKFFRGDQVERLAFFDFERQRYAEHLMKIRAGFTSSS